MMNNLDLKKPEQLEFNVSKNINLGVMVNVFEVTSNSLSLEKTIDALFKKAKFSKIRFVRLASHFKEFNEALKICKILKKKVKKLKHH